MPYKINTTINTFTFTSGAPQVVLVVKNPPADAGELRDMGSTPGSGRSSGGGHGNLLQYSCLENPMDREALWATAQRVTKSWTRLKQLSTQKQKLRDMEPRRQCRPNSFYTVGCSSWLGNTCIAVKERSKVLNRLSLSGHRILTLLRQLKIKRLLFALLLSPNLMIWGQNHQLANLHRVCFKHRLCWTTNRL